MMSFNFFVAVRLSFSILIFAGLAVASSGQQPLFASDNEELTSKRTWNFNFSSSAPHYFASVYGLLQQWPNTFFPNGHSIVPCEIPAFTKLYHGRTDDDVPPSPEWVAFDIGMSYGIMGGSRNSHMLTYQTKRAVKCIYFDGESASLMGSGQLHTQNLHIWGNTSGPARERNRLRGLREEYARALGLCDWIEEKKLGGSGWGVEGIVRMNTGFEMIWCNFSSPNLRLVSHLNVTAPLLPPIEDEDDVEDKWTLAGDEDDPSGSTSYYPLPPNPTKTERATDPTNPPAPPNWRHDMNREPFSRSQTWMWFIAGVAHYGSLKSGSAPGEMRVKTQGCGFMNYYAPKFMSAALSRANDEQKALNLTDDGLWKGPGNNGTRSRGLIALTRRRRAHTLEDVSPEDVAIMRQDSERVLLDLIGSTTNCSGMDWPLIMNEIVQTYATDLANFLKMLQGFEDVFLMNETAMRDWVAELREQTHGFLLPFLEFPNKTSGNDWNRGSALFDATFSRCRFHSTRLLDPNEGVYLGPEESTLKWAVEETTTGICTVLVDIGLSIEGVWNTYFNLSPGAVLPYPSILTSEITRWTEGVEELMAWLGWASEWADCDRKCAWDERCYIPMWPIIHIPNFGGRPGRRPPGRPPARRPGHDEHSPPLNDLDWLPENVVEGRPGDGFRWQPDESDLWQPKCIKLDYLLGWNKDLSGST